MPYSEEIEKRKLLWLALSDLWLNTEPTDSIYQMIVREIDISGYPLEELESIYAQEVALAVYSNLLTQPESGALSMPTGSKRKLSKI